MSSPFEQLDPTKKNKIIQAALEEFAEHKYEQASTNRIVKRAGIGKGMLFYYFNSKNELYRYLIDYSLDQIYPMLMEDYRKGIEEAGGDFIERSYNIARVKATFMAEEPNVFNFLGTVVIQDFDMLPAEVQQRITRLQEDAYRMLYEDVDLTLFKKELDREKAMNLIRWSLDGYQQDLQNQLKGEQIPSLNMDRYWDEFYAYLDILREAYYERGANNGKRDSD